MKNALCVLIGLFRDGSLYTDRPPRFRHRFVLGMLFIIVIHLCPGNVSADYSPSLSIKDYVAFADPGWWREYYGYTSWYPLNEYDTGTQDYYNYIYPFGTGHASGRAVSSASYGSLHAYTTMAVDLIGLNTTYTSASAGARWLDKWSVGPPGSTGSGYLKIGYNITGSSSTSYLAGWQIIWTNNPGGLFWGPHGEGNSAIQDFGTLYMPIDFGWPLDVEVRLNTWAEGGGTVNSADCTFAITGIQVVDSSYNPVSNFTFTAASGSNYSSVPAPTTLLLLGPGLIGLAALRRRFKR